MSERGRVDVEALRALVKQWRSWGSRLYPATARATGLCADQLEALLPKEAAEPVFFGVGNFCGDAEEGPLLLPTDEERRQHAAMMDKIRKPPAEQVCEVPADPPATPEFDPNGWISTEDEPPAELEPGLLWRKSGTAPDGTPVVLYPWQLWPEGWAPPLVDGEPLEVAKVGEFTVALWPRLTKPERFWLERRSTRVKNSFDLEATLNQLRPLEQVRSRGQGDG